MFIRAAPANTVFKATHIGLIDLDRTTKTIPPWPHYGRAQLLQESPCGLIASQPQQSL
jgi:hypothetical protein